MSSPPKPPGKSAPPPAPAGQFSIGMQLSMPRAAFGAQSTQAAGMLLPGLGAPFTAAPRPPAPRPANARAVFLHERGLTEAALCYEETAIGTLREATRADPAYAAAWRALAGLLRRAGDPAGAIAAEAAEARCPPNPAPAPSPHPTNFEAAEQRILIMLRAVPPAHAEDALRAHLLKSPTDAVALRFVGEMLLHAENWEEAQPVLERALQLQPDDEASIRFYIRLLMHNGRMSQARPHIDRLLAWHPRDAGVLRLHAEALAGAGDDAGAIEIYQALLSELPDQANLWLGYGKVLQYAGRAAESENAVRRALALAPAMGEAHRSLLSLSRAPSDADIAAMRAELARPGLPPAENVAFHYALGGALEKRGEYAASFAHYEAGAAARRAVITYNADESQLYAEQMRDFFTAALLASRDKQGCPDPAPIFVLGMPRAGSTLVEQVLSSHSQIEGTRELTEISDIVTELVKTHGSFGNSAYPFCLSGFSPRQFAALGESYIERTRPYRKTSRPFFIDKMPGNWTATGLIALILPNAKIIDARRAPMATCFGAFKKCFESGQDFTYDLTNLGRYYRDYTMLMAHFETVLPGRIHRVHYENMVENTEAEIRRLLDYCGLPFEPACLRFWETTRAVRTASVDQVRRPIFREGLDQWRHYEPWLGPLAAALAGGAAPTD